MAPPCEEAKSVTHVPGIRCYLCPRKDKISSRCQLRLLCVSKCRFSPGMQDSPTLRASSGLPYSDARMKNLLLTLLHLAIVAARLCGPGGVRTVIAENLLLKQQLIVLRRGRQRAPNLTRSDRLVYGFWSLFLAPGRLRKVAVALRPSTLL